MKAVITLKSRRAAAIFNHARQKQILLTTVAMEYSLSELATVTQTSLPLLHHHIRSFLKLGVVRISGERKTRRGLRVKLYRACAQKFFVPAELVPEQPNSDLHLRLNAAMERARAKTFKGIEYSHDGRGPRMRLVTGAPPDTASFEIWLEANLGKADASALLDELRTVIRKYGALSTPNGRKYILHAVLARL